MKPKKIQKMSLQKITVANIGNDNLNSVKGGTATGPSCTVCDSFLSCPGELFQCKWEYTCPPTCKIDCDDHYIA